MWVVTKQKGSCSLWAHGQRRSAGPGRRVRAVAPTLFKVRRFPLPPAQTPKGEGNARRAFAFCHLTRYHPEL